jgi:hypothetical protein
MEWEAHGIAEQFSNGRVLPGDTHHEKRVDGGKGLEDAMIDLENCSLYRE